MALACRTICISVLLFFLACFPARPQDVQFSPEIDVQLKLNSTFRAYLQAKDDREGGDPTQATIGPSLQLYLKPLIKLKEIKTFDLDDAKSRFLVLEAGYRYITAPDAHSENRMLMALTSNFPLSAGFFSPTETGRIWIGKGVVSPGDTVMS